MSREIKFRAWNYKKMVFNCAIRNSLIVNHKTQFYQVGQETNYPIMQYTGLKDKNEVEIYEGDILRCINHYDDLEENVPVYNYHQVVWFNNAWFQAWNITNKTPSTGNGNCALWVYKPFEIGEVIGNIYEDKNLLEDNS